MPCACVLSVIAVFVFCILALLFLGFGARMAFFFWPLESGHKKASQQVFLKEWMFVLGFATHFKGDILGGFQPKEEPRG